VADGLVLHYAIREVFLYDLVRFVAFAGI